MALHGSEAVNSQEFFNKHHQEVNMFMSYQKNNIKKHRHPSIFSKSFKPVIVLLCTLCLSNYALAKNHGYDKFVTIDGISEDSGINNDFITNDLELLITGSWVGRGELAVEFNGISYGTDTSQLTLTDDSWQLDMSSTTLTDGVYSVIAKYAPNSNSARIFTKQQDIEIKTSAPNAALTIESISDDTDIAGDFVTTDKSLLISGGWNNNSGNLTVEFNGKTYQLASDEELFVDDNFWHLDVTGYQLSIGEFEVIAAVEDFVGNKVSSHQLIQVKDIPVVVNFVDELADFEQVLTASYGMARESGDSYNRFNNDINRLKRVENTQEHVEYLMPGDIKSISVSAYYWTGEAGTSPFEIFVSQTGNDYQPLMPLTDSQATADGWQHSIFSVDGLEDGYDFVKVIFPKNNTDANPWHPQLGAVNITYHENDDLTGNNERGEPIEHSPISGGQDPLAVPDYIKTKTHQKFDYYITRGVGEDGDKLFNGDQEFRFVSYNVPELHMQESPFWDAVDEFETEDALKTIAAAGGQITRSYVLSVYNWQLPNRKLVHIDIEKDANGDPIRDGALIFNETLFVSLDKALDYANKHGVRIILPFIDRNSWWGGIESLAALRNLSADDYYTNATLIADYKTIVRKVLERTNTISGVRYIDDPAILAWETGNELRKAPDGWTAEMAAFIKSLDSNHLVIDGKEVDLSEASMNNPDIDIISNHYYGGDYKMRFMRDWQRVDTRKPFIVGETGVESSSEINDIVTAVADETDATGILLWSLRSQDAYGGFMDHKEDGTNIHAYHWPGFAENESSYDEQTVVNLLWDKAYSIRGLTKPELPTPNGTPVLLPIVSATDIRWQGVTNAQYYDVERTQTPDDNTSWQVVGDNIIVGGTDASHFSSQTVLDSLKNPQTVNIQQLFSDTDVQINNRYAYRVKAFNSSGASNYSNVVSFDVIFEDNLDTLPEGLSDASKLLLDSSNAANFAGDASRLMRNVNEEQFVKYTFDQDISAFQLESYYWRGGNEAKTNSFKVQLSADGNSWTDYNSIAQINGQIGDWQRLTLSGIKVNAGYRQIRIIFPLAADWDKPWATQLGHVKVATGELSIPISGQWFIDNLADLSLASAHSSDMSIDTGNAEVFGWDANRVKRSSNNYDSIIYSFDSVITAYAVDAYLWKGTDSHWGNYKIQLSVDGQIWVDAPIIAAALFKRGDWEHFSLSDLTVNTGYQHLKVLYPNALDWNNSWAAQVGKVKIAVEGSTIPL